MRLRKRVRVSVERTESTFFRLQELADFVHLAASNDISPGARVRLFVNGREIRNFTMEITHAKEEPEGTYLAREPWDGP